MKQTALHSAHQKMGAKMAEFAGYDMPIQYPEGVLNEHNWTRSHCGIFDVSHMGQITLEGSETGEFLEKLTPSKITALKDGTAKYTVLTNDEGGIIDDLIITRLSENKFFAVINAGCKDKDIEWIKTNLPSNIIFTNLDNRSLIAIQGPKAEKALKDVMNVDASSLNYMRLIATVSPCGKDIFVSRLGYTGEDGFELSVPEDIAKNVWNAFVEHSDVKPIGLAARDSLRLEMGYPLYGHDIDNNTSPIEADLTWVMGKVSNTSFIGNERVLKELKDGTSRQRIGIKLTDKGIARENSEIFSVDGKKIGKITSGGFSPTLQEAIGQGYIDSSHKDVGTKIIVRVRNRDIAAIVAPMPFISPKTKTVKKQAA